MARHFVPRDTTAPNPTKQNRENVACSATSMQATNALETPTIQYVIVVTAATAIRGYFNHVVPAALD